MINIMYIYQNISSNIIKYNKLQIKNEYIISFKWISKDKIKNRNNYSVAVNINYLNLILLKKIILIYFYIRLILLLIKMLIILIFFKDLKQKKYIVK